MTFENGQTFSNFKIIKKLGEGGMGEVYLAEDLKLTRKVAIKILQSEFFDSKDRQERFYREARTAAFTELFYYFKIRECLTVFESHI